MSNEEKKEWKPETFPQPRTFPKGWHFSALMASDKDKKEAAQEEADDWKPETFPQPRTIPENWHVEDKK
jgi:hypothetical protein